MFVYLIEVNRILKIIKTSEKICIKQIMSLPVGKE